MDETKNKSKNAKRQQFVDLDMAKKSKIYTHSMDYAVSNSEIDLYRESIVKNRACGDAIDNAIIKSNYEVNHYDLKAAAKSVITEHGVDRVNWVLANMIDFLKNDGRISQNTKNWMQNFDLQTDTFVTGCALNTHPYILDGFAYEVIKQSEILKKQSKFERKSISQRMKEKSAEIKAPSKNVAEKKQNNWEV